MHAYARARRPAPAPAAHKRGVRTRRRQRQRTTCVMTHPFNDCARTAPAAAPPPGAPCHGLRALQVPHYQGLPSTQAVRASKTGGENEREAGHTAARRRKRDERVHVVRELCGRAEQGAGERGVNIGRSGVISKPVPPLPAYDLGLPRPPDCDTPLCLPQPVHTCMESPPRRAALNDVTRCGRCTQARRGGPTKVSRKQNHSGQLTGQRERRSARRRRCARTRSRLCAPRGQGRRGRHGNGGRLCRPAPPCCARCAAAPRATAWACRPSRASGRRKSTIPAAPHSRARTERPHFTRGRLCPWSSGPCSKNYVHGVRTVYANTLARHNERAVLKSRVVA